MSKYYNFNMEKISNFKATPKKKHKERHPKEIQALINKASLDMTLGIMEDVDPNIKAEIIADAILRAALEVKK